MLPAVRRLRRITVYGVQFQQYVRRSECSIKLGSWQQMCAREQVHFVLWLVLGLH